MSIQSPVTDGQGNGGMAGTTYPVFYPQKLKLPNEWLWIYTSYYQLYPFIATSRLMYNYLGRYPFSRFINEAS